jgi:hypothetical protein
MAMPIWRRRPLEGASGIDRASSEARPVSSLTRTSCRSKQLVFERFTLEYFDVGDVALRVRHGGDGQPVVLRHGHPRTHPTRHRVAPQLAGSFFVACPDPR